MTETQAKSGAAGASTDADDPRGRDPGGDRRRLRHDRPRAGRPPDAVESPTNAGACLASRTRRRQTAIGQRSECRAPVPATPSSSPPARRRRHRPAPAPRLPAPVTSRRTVQSAGRHAAERRSSPTADRGPVGTPSAAGAAPSAGRRPDASADAEPDRSGDRARGRRCRPAPRRSPSTPARAGRDRATAATGAGRDPPTAGSGDRARLGRSPASSVDSTSHGDRHRPAADHRCDARSSAPAGAVRRRGRRGPGLRRACAPPGPPSPARPPAARAGPGCT